MLQPFQHLVDGIPGSHTHVHPKHSSQGRVTTVPVLPKDPAAWDQKQGGFGVVGSWPPAVSSADPRPAPLTDICKFNQEVEAAGDILFVPASE